LFDTDEQGARAEQVNQGECQGIGDGARIGIMVNEREPDAQG
jgi:hypothetical protein